ncbi:MAG: MaoC family dehydratase N-terminal domain-containing protein [Myxococcales bacterium]|nr:MaoC family dehydratase N-terminal domain-containing protein [Myxococcales bacterium]
MTLDPSAVGVQTEPIAYCYDERDAILYALGVGAKGDADLDFLYEGRGPRMLPTFGAAVSLPAIERLFSAPGGDLRGLVHGSQRMVVHAPLPPSGELFTVARLEGVYDLKRLAVCDFSAEVRDGGGALYVAGVSRVIYRFDGGFGGERPPPWRVHVPDRPPDHQVSDVTCAEQALLYRLSGDRNPLHADPEAAKEAGFDRPILHGMCTYGFVARAIIRAACGGDPDRLRVLSGTFTKPVWPGDTLVTQLWDEGERLIVQAHTEERPHEVVFGAAYAEVDSR